MENMQHIGNVNNVMNIDDGYLCSGARDVYAVNRRDPSKSSLGEMQPGSFADYDERIPAVDSLDDILGRSEESDDASNSFQPAKNKSSTYRQIKESDDAHLSSRRVTTLKDDKTENRRKINIARNGIGGTAIGLDDKRKPKPVQGKPKPALLSESRKRSLSPRKVTFNNDVKPIGKSVSSPRSNSLRRALERIQSYKKAAEERLGSRKPPTPYKVKPKEPSRLSRSLKIDTSIKDPPLAKLSPSKASNVLRDSKISKSVAEKSGRISSPKPPVLLTSEKHGERIYSCTTPENKRNALKSPVSSDLKRYGRNKTETMQEIRNRLFEDFRHFPIPERTSPRPTAPKPFYLRTDERIAFRHLIHPPEASYEEEELKFRPFKALPIPNYEADPLFYGIRKDWVGKRHTIPKPFQLSSPKNIPGKLRMSVDDEGVGRYRFRALPVPDFSYRPLSLSSHEVNLTTPYPFDLQLDQRMASRISFNGTARTNMLAKMYVRACSIIHEKDGHEHEVEVDKSRVEAKMPPKEAAYPPEIVIEQTSPVNRHKTHTISNTHQRMKTQVSNEVNQPATTKPSMLPTALQGNKVPAVPLSPNSKTSTPIAAISPRTRHLLKAQMMVRSAPSTPTGPRKSPKSKASFKAKKMPDFSRPFVPVKKPPSPIQSLPNTPPPISTESPRRSSMPITERRVRSAPSTPTGSSPKSKPTFKAKKMPDFSKPFVPVKKPPSPRKLLPSTPPPRIASESPRSSKMKMAHLSKSSVKEQPSPLQRIPKTPPRIATTSPRRTNVLNASAKMSPKHSTTTGISIKSTTRFKAKKMPDFSKPFVPVKKPPSPLRTATSPSQRTTSPKVTSSRISINSPKSISSVSSMTSSKSRLGLPKMNPKRMSPATAHLSQNVQTLNPPSPTAAFLSSNNQIKCSESGINVSPSYANDRKSTDSVTNRSRNKDLKSACSMTLNESFCARPMPNFSKPFVPVKTTDMERALVQAVSKDKHLLAVLDNKLNDYKNRLIAQEFGDIGDDLRGRKKIRQLADAIVKEVIDDVGTLRSPFSMNSSNHRRTVNLSRDINSDLHSQRHDSKMTKNELQQDLVKGVKTSDSGLSDSSNESSVDPYLSYSGTISPAGSTIEGDLSSKCSAVGTKGQDAVEFSSANSEISRVHLPGRGGENQRYDSTQKSPSCTLPMQSQETTDNVDSSKDHAIACPSSFSKVSYDDDNVGDFPSNGSGPFEARKKDVHNNNDEDTFENFSRPSKTDLEVNRQESDPVIDIHLVNRAIAETNSIHASKPDVARPISHEQHVTGMVSHTLMKDEVGSNTPREHHVNGDSKCDESSFSKRNARDGSCSLAAAFDESSVAYNSARGSSSISFHGPVDENNIFYNGLSSFGTSTNSLQGPVNENTTCAASDESSTCLPRDDAHVKTATHSQVLPLKHCMESDQHDSTRYEEGVLLIDAVEDCENTSRFVINDRSTASDIHTVSHEYDPSEENSAIFAVDELPVSLETEVGSTDQMNGRIHEDSRYNGRSSTDQTSKDKTSSTVTIESLVAHETVGGSSNYGDVNEESSYNASSSSALSTKEVTFDESLVTHKTARGTSSNSLQGPVNENTTCAASDESSACLLRDDTHVKTATHSQVLPLKHCMESDQRDSTRYEEGVLLIDAVEDSKNTSRFVINDSSTASDNRTVSHEYYPSEENSTRLSKDNNDIRGRVNDNSSFDEISHHSPPNTDSIPQSRVVAPEKDISSTAFFSTTSSDVDDDPSHKQFSSHHTESSLTKVLHSLHNTIERISLIERKFEQKSESSSISKAKMGSPMKSSASFQGKTSPNDDFGSETIAFRAGWKRALALTDLIECQDENLSPDTCRSLKVVESRFILSKVNNDFEEARDECVLNSRGKEHSEKKTPTKSRALGSPEKQHFSLYDSVLRCCSGKGELE